jgi:hypothetical protein
MDEELDKIPKPISKEYRLKSIEHVNHKPHPYMITPSHVAFASDHYCGRLGQLAIEEAEKTGRAKCGWQGCNLACNEHTSDKVLFIKALVDKPIKELKGLKKYLLSIKQTLIVLKIDGVAFIEPDKKGVSKDE